MRILRSYLFGLILGLLLVAQDAYAARRVALVVGNAKYAHAGSLANTINDSHAIATLLKRAGFDSVEEKTDLGVVEMKRALRDFAGMAASADVAVIYYSGHGIEASGVNYLIPVDAKLANALDVEDETVPLDRLTLATANVKSLSLIILDACRENPFVRSEQITRAITTHTIGEQATGANTLIAYAAKAGSLSYDGVGPNSPFTTALVKHIAEPGLDIRIALGQVRDDVLMATGGRQEPYVYGSLGGGTIALAPAAAAPASTAQADPLASMAADYALTERVGTADAWRAFLESHRGGGFYAELARAQLNRLGRQAPAAATAAVAAVAPKPASDPCEAENARLAVLRGNPEPQAVAEFVKSSTCAALKPQLNRLVESAGLGGVGTQLASRKPDAAGCEGEGRELERLRADPDPAAVQALYARLVCPSLKPQVQRLLESLGEAPKINSTKAFASADACAAEARELSRLRANPDRSATLAFAKNVTCAALKPQAARLVESLAE